MSECEHRYKPSKRGYYKLTGDIGGIGLPTYDQSITYATLFCEKCGDIKEVVWANHCKDKSQDASK